MWGGSKKRIPKMGIRSVWEEWLAAVSLNENRRKRKGRSKKSDRRRRGYWGENQKQFEERVVQSKLSILGQAL